MSSLFCCVPFLSRSMNSVAALKRTRQPIEVLLIGRLNHRFDRLSNVRIIKHLLPLQMRAVCNLGQLYREREKWLAIVTNHHA